MISTATVSTVSILSVSVIATSLAPIGVLVLISLLVQKELATAAESSRSQRFSQALNIGIVPLLIAFVLIVAFKVAEVMK